ncbi:MAG: LamG domain-containing protein [Sphingomonas sp.]|nr:MAG: LamG domain-containing protein [Sphingomonas sp.]
MDRRAVIGRGTLLGASLFGPPAAASPIGTSWIFDNLARIGSLPVTLTGAPALAASPWGPAVAFDGVRDALFLPEHPLAGAATFTIEALFRPDGGAIAQRWLHLEAESQPPVPLGTSDTRMMFELRIVDGHWYLDAFATGPGYRRPLMAANKRFPLGRWYHVAQSYDGTTYRSFVNGEVQAAAAIAFRPQGPGRTSVGVRLNQVDYFHGAACTSPLTNER